MILAQKTVLLTNGLYCESSRDLINSISLHIQLERYVNTRSSVYAESSNQKKLDSFARSEFAYTNSSLLAIYIYYLQVRMRSNKLTNF